MFALSFYIERMVVPLSITVVIEQAIFTGLVNSKTASILLL